MIENSNRIGRDFKHELELISSFSDKIKDIRGLGLMNAIEFDDDKNAKRFVQLLIENGILTKTTKENTVRLTPPLTLDYEDSWKSLEQIEKSLKLL